MTWTQRPVMVRGARLVDPGEGLDEVGDCLVADGRIRALGGRGDADGAQVIEAEGLWLVPGLVDPHVHLREPGLTHKEDIATGARAAVAGGFVAVAAMPNTRPVVDSPELITYVRMRSDAVGLCRVLPVGAITRGQAGRELAQIGDMAAAGAVALSDDGQGVQSAGMMRCALRYASAFGLPLLLHEQDDTLAGDGVVHEGAVATRLGLAGQPREAEEAMVLRDVHLVERNGGRIHLCHLSTAGAVQVVREAKARGLRVSAEVTPHHLLLTDEAARGYDTRAKCNPPLRTDGDRRALVDGLVDGTIDCIATDHAPHTDDEKEGDFVSAAFGISGLETALALVLTHLVDSGRLSPAALVERMSFGPCRVLGLCRHRLREGAVANLTLIDPGVRWTVEPQRFHSRGHATPFAGARLKGRSRGVFVDGRWMAS